MAKKNKKNSKVNQKIREYFDGDPFDVGIERVSSETLSELFATLGIYDIQHKKKLLIKTIRMIWSEPDGGYKREIVNFFEANGEIYVSDRPKHFTPENSNRLELILEEIEMSQEEATKLLIAFTTTKSKKITSEIVESKLRHIRFENKKERIEKELDGFFESDESLEFNASIEYKVYDQVFHKIVTLNTKPYEYSFLQESDFDTICAKIYKEKLEIIAKEQERVEKFISSLKVPHAYLTTQEITTSLRANPPKTELRYPLMSQKLLRSIIEKKSAIENLELHDKEVLLQTKQTLTLPFSVRELPYILEIHVELDGLLGHIWNAERFNFDDTLAQAKEAYEKEFLHSLEVLVQECGRYAQLLHFTEGELHEKVYEFLLELLPPSLIISPKIVKKTVRIFIYNIQEQLVKKQRQQLLARTIRDFKNLFPLARDLRRKLILHIGPTNSGKTYQAMQKLQVADTGYYLAPLRLLALEGYETLKSRGIESSLITGEEQILDDDATHISSTIEMLNFDVDVDVCVIDEVQMIDDRDRGWAWANAIIGAPAKEIIMTGSANSKEAIVALAEYLGEELEIIEFERKNPLTLLEVPTNRSEIQEGTAIIAFSRRDVLRLKQELSSQFRVSVVYGNLSPEVRREEARRFRAGETQLLVATDAIAMGMNLPIKTILFSKAEKFDGVRSRNLMPWEVHQISGRAGRFGLSEEGFVGALSPDVLKIVHKNFYKRDHTIKIPFRVMANLEHITLVGKILEEKSLYEILKFFVKNMEFNGPFHAASLDDMLEASLIVDKYDLDTPTKYHLSCAPLTLKSPYIVAAFESYLYALEREDEVHYSNPILLGAFAQTTDDLLHAEDMVKEISLYLWLGYRFSEFFIDEKKARQARGLLNKYIEKTLQQNQLANKCKLCGVTLPLNSKYNICQNCFKKNYTHHKGKNRRYNKK